MTAEEFINEHLEDQSARALAGVYLPVISRWAADEGWEVIRKWLYTFGDISWNREILHKMTVPERRAEDARRLAVVKHLSIDNARRIIQERALLQQIFTSLFTALMGNL